MKPFESVPAGEAADEPSPFDIEFYTLQGVGFRCMGYRDERGKWRNAFSNAELYGEIRILD